MLLNVFLKKWKGTPKPVAVQLPPSVTFVLPSTIISLTDFHFRLERCRMAQPEYVYTKPGQDGHERCPTKLLLRSTTVYAVR